MLLETALLTALFYGAALQALSRFLHSFFFASNLAFRFSQIVLVYSNFLNT